jgi:class 3 adenylate cyclase
MIHGTLLFVFLTLFQSNIVSAQGRTEDFESLGLHYFIIITLMVFFKGFSFTNRITHKLSYIFIGVLCLILILAITCNYKLGYSFTTNYSIVHRGAIWTIICLIPDFSLISSYANIDQLFKASFKSRIDQYSNKIQRVFIDSTDWKIHPNDNSLEINKRFLNFKSLFKEREYLEVFFSKNLFFTRLALIMVVIIAIINLILVLASVPSALEFSYYTVFPTVLAIIYPFITYIKSLNWIEYHYFIFAATVITIIIDAALDTSRSTILRYPILMVLFSVSFSFNWFVSLIQTIILYAISIIFCSFESQEKNPQGVYIITFHWIIIMLAYSVLILIITSYRGLSTRADFAFLQKVEIEVEKAANILGYLLPEFVKKRVKEGVRYIAEDKGTVSVVFCDMCDFDKIVNLYSPQELTYFLDDVFGRIDLLCENLGVSKIETVGKTYLACAGLKDSESVMDSMLIKVPHARRAVELGIAIMKEMEKVELKDGSTLMFKIGINSGPVTAGVVGHHKPQFSLVGDTVNTSSRMSSTLTEPNSILIIY